MTRDRTPALWTFRELRTMPAVGRFTRAEAHFGGFAFWNSHRKRNRKAGNQQKTRDVERLSR